MAEDRTGKKAPPISRRDFLRNTALTAGALSVAGAGIAADAREGTGAETAGPPIKVAGYRYDRIEPLASGRIGIKGFDVKFETAAIGDMNTDVFSGSQSREITEIGLHPFMLAWANDGFRDYSLLPVFPLRVFRHKSIFIRTDRGIKGPGDLKGKTVATPGYSSTSLTWIRGILEDEYRVSPRDVRWVTSSKDSSAEAAGKASKQESMIPEGITITPGPTGKDESDLLADGDVDALFHAAEPRCYVEGHPEVGRLFIDYRATEQRYFKKTGIFPIMHAVAVRKAAMKKYPGLVRAAFDAYSGAKRQAFDRLTKLGWAYESLPWVGQELAETRAVMGDNYYSYGVEPNRKTLEALFRYSHQQGLCSRELTVEELFEPVMLDLTDNM